MENNIIVKEMGEISTIVTSMKEENEQLTKTKEKLMGLEANVDNKSYFKDNRADGNKTLAARKKQRKELEKAIITKVFEPYEQHLTVNSKLIEEVKDIADTKYKEIESAQKKEIAEKIDAHVEVLLNGYDL